MDKKVPMRQCVACGAMKYKNDMFRVLKMPDGNIVYDASGKMNGRGAYLCKSQECLCKTKKNKRFERAFKRNIPAMIYDSLEKEFAKD